MRGNYERKWHHICIPLKVVIHVKIIYDGIHL